MVELIVFLSVVFFLVLALVISVVKGLSFAIQQDKQERWKTAYFCVHCNKQMSYNTMMYSNGRCPFCAYKHPHAATVVRTYEKAYTHVKITPWWMPGGWEVKWEEELEA